MVEGGGYRMWLLFALVTAALRLPACFLPFFAKDEATYSALAAKLLSGSLFYVGAVDHKPPGMALTYAFVFWLTGVYRLLGIRLALLAVVVATSVLIGETARRLFRSPRARIAGLLYATASAIGLPGDMQAANTELFLNLPLAAAAFLLADGDHAATFAAVGFLTGLGALFKYQAAAAGLAWAAAALVAGGGIGRIASRLAALLAGITPVVLGLCGFYWLRGEWPAFWFWGWQYNFAYMSLVSPSIAMENAIFYTLLAGVLWLPLVICLAERRVPRPFLALAWLAAMVPALAAGGRFFPHYYLMPLPPVCLLAAPGFLAIADGHSRRLRLVEAFTALGVAVTIVLSWGWYSIKPGLADSQRSYTSVAAYVRAHGHALRVLQLHDGKNLGHRRGRHRHARHGSFCRAARVGRARGRPRPHAASGDRGRRGRQARRLRAERRAAVSGSVGDHPARVPAGSGDRGCARVSPGRRLVGRDLLQQVEVRLRRLYVLRIRRTTCEPSFTSWNTLKSTLKTSGYRRELAAPAYC